MNENQIDEVLEEKFKKRLEEINQKKCPATFKALAQMFAIQDRYKHLNIDWTKAVDAIIDASQGKKIDFNKLMGEMKKNT